MAHKCIHSSGMTAIDDQTLTLTALDGMLRHYFLTALHRGRLYFKK